MIARLEGTLISVEEGGLILDVNGVGFFVRVPAGGPWRVGERAILQTTLQVRENDLSLYGFAESEQKVLFEALLTVNGVGPKAALSLLGIYSTDALRRAIINNQPEALTRAPGVGKKTAEAIVLHLKDRLGKLAGAGPALLEDDTDVIATLTALGFSLVEAQRAVQQLPRGESLSVEEKIRRALALLGR
jgi:Holliday junction DNA helicase RuvA